MASSLTNYCRLAAIERIRDETSWEVIENFDVYNVKSAKYTIVALMLDYPPDFVIDRMVRSMIGTLCHSEHKEPAIFIETDLDEHNMLRLTFTLCTNEE